MGISTREVGAK
ncbi:hypothetical protein pipiens_000299, partial [Culex pipiens pipiens]